LRRGFHRLHDGDFPDLIAPVTPLRRGVIGKMAAFRLQNRYPTERK
jgi:hypothetical protein